MAVEGNATSFVGKRVRSLESAVLVSSNNNRSKRHRVERPEHPLEGTCFALPTGPNCELPDEVLVSVLRFVRSASGLARLRAVCKRWRSVIDANPAVWRSASFRGAQFSRPVMTDNDKIRKGGKVALCLGERCGKSAVELAANAGNEWALFLKDVVFDGRPLRAITVVQPMASLLVSGERSLETRSFPPWGDSPCSGCGSACSARCACNGMNCHHQHRGRRGCWVAIHAARRPNAAAAEHFPLNAYEISKLPRGAVVGMVHVAGAKRLSANYSAMNIGSDEGGVMNSTGGGNWTWCIDRAVSLQKPIRCAGFLGLWTLSQYLTEVLVRALHTQ